MNFRNFQQWQLLLTLHLLASVSRNFAEAATNYTDEKFCKTENAGFIEEPQTLRSRKSEDRALGANDECSLYLAKSSIPNAGVGIYTAVPLPKGSIIHPDSGGDLFIPLMDSRAEFEPSLLSDIKWSVNSFSSELFFLSNYSLSILEPGFAATNCYFGLNNIEHYRSSNDAVPHSGSIEIDSAGLHRSVDPGVGAFTNYYNVRTVAARDIVPGEELFINYGEHWFETRAPQLGSVPTEHDFAAVDQLLEHLFDNTTFNSQLPTPQDEGNDVDYSEIVEELLSALHQRTTNENIKVVLPRTAQEFEVARRLGAARLSLPDSKRTLEWLQTSGICVDNLYVNISYIPQAGRGAFAKREVSMGSIISPVPVFQVSKSLLEDPYQVKRNVTNPKQLLWNYAYGHVNSSVLLVPYAPMVNYINHNRRSPNAALRWRTSSNSSNTDRLLTSPDWFSKSSKEILISHLGLIMELVALRDIMPAEEVTIDYGVAWEEAWESYARQWDPPMESSLYQSARELMARGLFEIRTLDEQNLQPYSNNVQTACIYSHIPAVHSDGNIRHSETLTGTRWSAGHDDPECIIPCKVLSRQMNSDEQPLYTAEMMEVSIHGFRIRSELPVCMQVISENERVVISNIPKDKIILIDRPYSQDQHLKTSFRHEIGLPDGVFPTAWHDK